MTRDLTRGRAGALLGALALATFAWMFSAPPETVAALAPTQTAWWDVANQNGAPAVPPPSDVDTTKHDLYVQGAGGSSGPNPAPIPQPNNAQGGAQAVAAIHYAIPDGGSVQKLTLKITGNKPPTAPGVVACRITDLTFKSEDNGPVSDIPKYDCGTQSVGKPNAAGDAVEFSDIGKLVKGSELLVVLVPGQLDRVVFAHPDATALETTGGDTSTAPFSAPAGAPFGASTDTGTSSSASSFSVPAAALAPVGEPPLPAPLPTQAPSAATSRRILGAAPAIGASRLPLSPQQTRLVVGAATLASIAAFAAMVLLGPRMTASGATLGGAEGSNVRGVGRFARPRSGPAPRIW